MTNLNRQAWLRMPKYQGPATLVDVIEKHAKPKAEQITTYYGFDAPKSAFKPSNARRLIFKYITNAGEYSYVIMPEVSRNRDLYELGPVSA